VFGFLKSSAKARTRVGVAVSGPEAVLAAVRRPAGARPVLERVFRAPAAEAVAAACDAGYARAAVSLVLAEDEYQLAMIEAPDVLPAEMRAAVRWKLRDAIDFHVDDAVVDVFDLPAQGRRSQGRMMYAVAAKRAAVDRHVRALDGLRGTDVVDVPELCLRNLAQLLPAAEHGVAMLHLGERTATVVIVRGAALYLARRVDLQAAVRLGGGDGEIDASAVALQLQRSLDYYESHYDQPPIAEVAVLPAGDRAASLADGLAADTGLRVGVYDLADRLDCIEPPAADLQQACVLAVGAALREERRTP
jgi:MSHA biogenesis protein MshI